MRMVSEIPTPVVTIEKDVLERNIRRMADLSRRHGLNLRPHVKTHNVPEIAALQLREGAAGITVATLPEARAMARHGMTDVFIAREITDWADLKELAELSQRADVGVAADSEEGVKRLSQVMADRGAKVSVLLEVDVGGHRCGMSKADEVIALARRVQDAAALAFRGIFTHEGHVYGAADLPAIRAIAAETVHRMRETADALAAQGLRPKVVSVGSSPSVKTATAFDGITEIRPGNYVFNDAMQVANGAAAEADCALKVIATVVSKPEPGRFVLNVGSKLLGSDRGRHVSDTGGYGWVVSPERHVISRLYEEHSVVDSPGTLAVGQRVVLLPTHACIVANLARAVFLVDSQGGVLEHWPNRRFSDG
jgi:D-serine deaminase-like pyridoxal phosphate-dependent protein